MVRAQAVRRRELCSWLAIHAHAHNRSGLCSAHRRRRPVPRRQPRWSSRLHPRSHLDPPKPPPTPPALPRDHIHIHSLSYSHSHSHSFRHRRRTSHSRSPGLRLSLPAGSSRAARRRAPRSGPPPPRCSEIATTVSGLTRLPTAPRCARSTPNRSEICVCFHMICIYARMYMCRHHRAPLPVLKGRPALVLPVYHPVLTKATAGAFLCLSRRRRRPSGLLSASRATAAATASPCSGAPPPGMHGHRVAAWSTWGCSLEETGSPSPSLCP